MMNQQSISNSPDTAPMMENVNTFKEKLEVLPPDVLETWLRHNQNHPFAFIGLGVKAEQEKMRAGRQAGPTPTVYEEQVGNRGMTSLGMPGNPDAMTPQMATRMVEGVNTPRDMPPQMAAHPGTEGVAGLPTPSDMYMNNGGIVGFAAGDLVEGLTDEEIEAQIEADRARIYSGEATGPELESRWDQATDWAGDVGSSVADWARENPIEATIAGVSTGLMAVPTPWTMGAGATLRGGLAAYKGLSALQKARRLAGTPLRVTSSLGKGVGNVGKRLVTRPTSTKVSINTPIGKAVGTKMGRKFAPGKAGRNLALAYGAGKGGGAAYDYLTDPREMPDHPITAKDLTPAESRKKQKDAVEFLEAQKKAKAKADADAAAKAAAAAKAKADAADKATKKDGSISEKNMLLMELGLGMLGDTETTGGALGSLGRSGVSALKSSAVRKAAEADREFKQATLDLQKKSLAAENRKMDLVYKAAIRGQGISQKELLTLKAAFQEDEYPQILNDALVELKAINDDTWFGFGKKNTSELNAEAKKLADARGKEIFKKRQIEAWFSTSGGGLGSLGGGVPSADGYSAELIGG